MSASRFLLVRMGAMGDVVHTLPAAATLRAAFPEAEIDWLVEEGWAPLLDDNPHLSAVHRIRRRDWRRAAAVLGKLRSRAYDTVLDFQGLVKSAALARLAGAREVIGFRMEALREKLAAACYDRLVRPQGAHVIEHNLALARAAGAGAAVMEFPLPAGDCTAPDGDFLMVSPSAGWPAKRWPPESFARLIQMVHAERGWTTLVNHGPGEEELARRIVDQAGGAGQLTGRAGLKEMIALARRARAFVAGDTGPLHIAAAVGTPVVAIFGPTSPERNGPWSPQARVVRPPRVDTTYSRRASGEAIAKVAVEEVFAALQGLLGK